MTKRMTKGYILSDDRIVSAEQYDNAILKMKNTVLKGRRPESTDSTPKAISPLEQEGTGNTYGFVNKFIEPPIDIDLLESAFILNSVHYRCCVIKAEDTTSKGYVIEPKNFDRLDAKDDTRLKDKTFLAQQEASRLFMESIDGEKGSKALIDAVVKDYESIGWGAVEVIRTIGGDIANLVPVPAKELRWTTDGYIIQVRGNKSIRFVNFGEKFLFEKTEGGEGRVLKAIRTVETDGAKEAKKVSIAKSANELLIIKHQNNYGGAYGIPDVVASMISITNIAGIDNYLAKFFDNHAVPQYAVVIEGADEVDNKIIQLIRHYFKKEIKGKPHTTLVLSTPDGVEIKFEKLSADTKEASFQDTKKVCREDILIAHGVTPAQVGIINTANLGSGSGLSQAENYKNRVVIPLQKKVQDQFWGKIFGWQGLNYDLIQVRYNELDIRDYEELMEQHKAYLDRGAMTINETRRELGYPPIEGGSRAFLRLSNEIVFVDAFEHAGDSMGGMGANTPTDGSGTNQGSNDGALDKQIQKALKRFITKYFKHK